MRLYLKIVLLVLLIVISSGVSSSLLVSRVMRHTMDKELEARVVIVAKTLAQHITHNVIHGEIVTALEILRRAAKQIEDVEYIYVVGFDGRVFAHSFERGFPRALVHRAHEMIRSDVPCLARYSTEHAPILEVTCPLIEGMRAHFHVGINQTHMHGQIRGIRNRIIGFTLGIALLGALVGTILSYRITHPLALLAKSMRAFGSGKAEEEIDLRGGGREVTELTQSFNQMLTERRQVEEVLSRVNRALRVLSECNQALVRATDESSLLHDICRITVEVGGYRLAWVGFAEQDEAKTVGPVAQVGYEEGYLDMLNITWADTERGRGPTGMAIRTGKPFIAKNLLTDPNYAPWRIEATKRGYASSIALPLISDGQAFGALNIYAEESDAFDVEEVNRLMELTDDLSYGIMALRTLAERKRADEALRFERNKVINILDSMADGVYIVNQQYNIEYVNPVLRKEFGAVEGRKCFEYFHDREEVCPRCKNPEVFAGKTVRWEWYSSKNQKMYDLIDTPLKNPDGSISKLEIFRDITDMKQAEEEKKKLEMQLRQAQKMEAIGTLAGGIAHDFNNILGAIIGYTEIADLQVTEDNKAKESLKEVLKAGRRARDLVKQILAFSRKGEQERIPIQINPIVKEAMKLLRSSLPTTIEIRQNIESDTGIVEADPTQIHQILMNLCANAAHAMREEGGVLEVGIRDVEVGSWDSELGYLDMTPGPYLLLTVSDTGEGMTPEILGRIFDPYFTTKEKGVGTGLGLAVVHGIVKIYGGTIRAYSEPGKGTTFHVYLPRIEEAKEMAEEESRPGVIPTGQERILFIDDEPVLVEIGKQMLERLGYEVTTRTSSIEALELFKAKPDRFDLVITDMTMPNMTGDKLSRELMQIRHDIPIIICTGYSERITEDKAKGMGIKAFVMKPIVIRDLANSVREVLEGGKEKPAEGLILVIDDDDQFRGMLREMLGRAGYEVADAPNGKEGIRLYRENPADLVITDIIMPEKEGIETIMDLRREFPEVKIIAMSGGGRIDPEEYLHMAKRLGADRTFAKPVERDELLKAVREVLGDPALSKRKG